MAHVSSIGASLFSDLSVTAPTVYLDSATLAGKDTAGELQALFATETTSIGVTTGPDAFIRIKGVREYPALGTPPNIVNVPGYGSKTSQQIQGQSDAPSMELTVNYVAAEWADGTGLKDIMESGKQVVFRFTLLNDEPAGYESVDGAGGIGSKDNSQYYWVGKIEALQVNPQLTDATTATITISIQSQFFGAYTNAPTV